MTDATKTIDDHIADLAAFRARQEERNKGNGQHDQGSEEEPAPRLVLTPFEMIDERPLEPQRFLIDRILPAGESAMLHGPERNFKSFVVMEMALSIVLGRPFLGKFGVERAGTVIYIDLENVMDRFRERVHASLARDNMARSALGGRLLMYDRPRDVRVPRWCFDAICMDELGRAVEAHKPDLVVVDNLRKALHGHDEKDNKEMLPLMDHLLEQCRRADAFFLVVHHDTKDKLGYSGAGSIASTLANEFWVQRDATTDTAEIACKSMRNAEHFDPFAITLGTDVALRLVEVEAAPRDTGKMTTDGLRRLILDKLKDGKMTIYEIVDPPDLTYSRVRGAMDFLVKRGAVADLGNGGKGGAREFGLAVRPAEGA